MKQSQDGYVNAHPENLATGQLDQDFPRFSSV
jgi:hypothetical protein